MQFVLGEYNTMSMQHSGYAKNGIEIFSPLKVIIVHLVCDI